MFKAAFLGDSRTRVDDVLFPIIEHIERRGDIHIALHSGDVVQSASEDATFERYLQRIGRANTRFVTARGNHDVGLFKRFSLPLWQSVDIEDCRFLVLDNAQDNLGAEQKEWIEAKLDADRRLFVIAHKPLYDIVFPNGTRATHNMGEQPGGNADAKWLVNMCGKHDVQLVIVGHYHGYAVQTLKNGITMLLEGRAGAPQYGSPTAYGYTLMTVYDDLWITQRIDI